MNTQENLPIDQGITEIAVQGFKSLSEESRIEIRPLTILAGANSSGKSSIMQPLLLMKQTLEAPYDPGSLLLDGNHVKFSSSDQLISLENRYNNVNFPSNGFTLQINFANPLDILGFKNFFGKNEFGLNVLQTSCFYKINEYIKEIAYNRDLIEKAYIFDQIQNFQKWETHGFNPPSSSEEIKVVIEKCKGFLSLTCTMQLSSDNTPPKQHTDTLLTSEGASCFALPVIAERLVYENIRDINILSNLILNIIHLPGLRGKTERNYVSSGIAKKFPGTFDNYFASMIHHWQINQDSRIEELNKYLQNLGLTSKVTASRPNDISIELQVGLSKNISDILVNIADVGRGVSQVLPVLVALLVAEPGQLVYLEEPELHLHPRAQANLAQPLIDAANRGVKVVVETHSDLLLTRIQTLVAEEAIDPAKLILHWFSRGDDGMTKIASAELDQAGAYGDFPIDFNDVAFKEDLRYVEAAESQLIKK